MLKRIIKPIVHTINGTRKFYYSKLREYAPQASNKRILEIGSGIPTGDKHTYSAKHIFKEAKEFRQTDMNPDYGHEVLDITTMDLDQKYDVILCLNVLEHVYDYQKSIDNLHKSLKEGGVVYIAVPFFFPLHDEPTDYWRFTEHALRKMLSSFSEVNVEYKGIREAPFGYFVTAKK